MIVAAHQPNFLPWLGFFDRLRKADLFVLADHVQFERQNYQNRTLVNTWQGPRWLIVPVFQRSRSERIVDKVIDERAGDKHWGRRAYLTLEFSYGRAPYFRDYAPTLQQIFSSRWEKLVELNLTLLDFCLDALEIRTPLVRSSDLHVTGLKSDMVLNLCKAVGADVYLGGMGGSRGYLDVQAFERAGVQVVWQEFAHPGYPQVPSVGGFQKGLSVLDLLFNCGPAAKDVLRGETPPSLEEPVAVSVAAAAGGRANALASARSA